MSEAFKVEHAKFTLVGNTDQERMKLFLDATCKPEKVAPAPAASGPAGAPDAQAQPLAATQNPEQRYPFITRQEILAALPAQIQVDESHLGVIDDIADKLSKGESIKERRIAKGSPPEPGSSGKLLLLVKPFTGKGEHGGQNDAASRHNLNDLHLFDNIQKGNVVARIYPPKNGKNGRDVLGKEISAAAGQPIKVQIDKTLKIEATTEQGEKFDKVVAEVDGLLIHKGSDLVISEVLEIRDDLDLKFGNIDFIGSVKIKGDVAPGLNIRAKKGIEISGGVRGGIVESSGGDINLKGFLFCGEQGRVVGGRNVYLNVVQEARVEALGDVHLAKEAIESTLRAGASILGPKAQIVGGTSFAVCGVEARVVGSSSGTKTVIHLCSNVEGSADYAKLMADIANHERAAELLTLHLGPYAKDPSRIHGLNAKLKDHMTKLHVKLNAVMHGLGSLRAKQKEALVGAQMNKSVRVNYHQTLHSGVVITVGEKVFAPTEDLKGPGTIEYLAEKQEFLIGPMQGIECAFKLEDPKDDKKKK